LKPYRVCAFAKFQSDLAYEIPSAAKCRRETCPHALASHNDKLSPDRDWTACKEWHTACGLDYSIRHRNTMASLKSTKLHFIITDYISPSDTLVNFIIKILWDDINDQFRSYLSVYPHLRVNCIYLCLVLHFLMLKIRRETMPTVFYQVLNVVTKIESTSTRHSFLY
jgi:hypothetical protein